MLEFPILKWHQDSRESFLHGICESLKSVKKVARDCIPSFLRAYSAELAEFCGLLPSVPTFDPCANRPDPSMIKLGEFGSFNKVATLYGVG